MWFACRNHENTKIGDEITFFTVDGNFSASWQLSSVKTSKLSLYELIYLKNAILQAILTLLTVDNNLTAGWQQVNDTVKKLTPDSSYQESVKIAYKVTFYISL